MRWSPWLSVCLLAALGSSQVRAQTPTAPLVSHHALGLEVRVTATGGESQARSGLKLDPGGIPLGGGWSTAETRDYSQHREQYSAITLAADVNNLGTVPENAKIDWYFFGQSIDTRHPKDFEFEQGHQDLSLAPGSRNAFTIKSRPLKSTVTKELHTTNGVNSIGMAIPPSASVKKTGSKLYGWIVRLLVDGNPLIIRASSPALEALAADENRLEGYPKK